MVACFVHPLRHSHTLTRTSPPTHSILIFASSIVPAAMSNVYKEANMKEKVRTSEERSDELIMRRSAIIDKL